MKKIIHFCKTNRYMRLLLASLILTLLLEILGRHSAGKAFVFAASYPLTFLFNLLIVWTSLCFSLLFRRRYLLALSLIELLWIILGVVNAVVLRYRMTPFSAEDFSMIKSLTRIIKNYLTGGMLIVILAAVVLLLILLILLIRFLPRKEPGVRLRTGILMPVLLLLAVHVLMIPALHFGIVSNHFKNLADAYRRYGFAYCFTTSITDVGISRPKSYSREMIREIADGMRRHEQEQVSMNGLISSEIPDTLRPNIIMIQLESFFDPVYLDGFTYSEDPIPVFRSLKNECGSGFFTVPVVGAGTANTEFEVLTGMSTDYFGAGEYPYNTVLKEQTIESVPNVLRPSGYTSSVIHNNTGTFYNRDTVFSHMGFDAFIPAEFMYDLETTPNNWAKDNVLTGVVMDCMNQSESRDFVYVITVQSHGRYPEEEILTDPLITVEKKDETLSDGFKNTVTYYVNEIKEVDDMIGELVQELTAYPEPTVLVLYGDHLPALGFEEEQITQPSVYMTEYVLWNNFHVGFQDQAMDSETISAAILNAFGLSNGIIPTFHKSYDKTEKYSEYLELLEYDMLYGEGYIFREFADDPLLNAELTQTQDDTAGENDKGWQAQEEPDTEQIGYAPSDMTIGYLPITISSWEIKDGTLFVYGENFNEASRIVIDEKPMDTLFIDDTCLQLDAKLPDQALLISTGQFDENLQLVGELTNTLEGYTEPSS